MNTNFIYLSSKFIKFLLIYSLVILKANASDCEDLKCMTNALRAPNIFDVDFDLAMGKDISYCYINFFRTAKNLNRYEFFKSLYKKNSMYLNIDDVAYKIPKIIHQIWIGPKPFPEKWIAFSDKWKELHPNWEYKLWTEKNLDELNFDLKDLYEEALNPAHKSDLLRYAILKEIGGLYVDVDFEPIKGFDNLNKSFNFYCGIHPPSRNVVPNFPLEVGNAIIASCPNHPILETTIKLIRQRWKNILSSKYDDIWKTIISTMYPLRDAVILVGKKEEMDRSIVFPPTYFYPILPQETLYIDTFDPGSAFQEIKEETFAIHHWGMSWIR